VLMRTRLRKLESHVASGPRMAVTRTALEREVENAAKVLNRMGFSLSLEDVRLNLVARDSAQQRPFGFNLSEIGIDLDSPEFQELEQRFRCQYARLESGNLDKREEILMRFGVV